MCGYILLYINKTVIVYITHIHTNIYIYVYLFLCHELFEPKCNVKIYNNEKKPSKQSL